MIELHDEQLALLGGAASKSDVQAAFGQLNPAGQARVRELEAAIMALAASGTSLCWALVHAPAGGNGRGKPEAFFTRVSMRKGPGDIKKGSFGEFKSSV